MTIPTNSALLINNVSMNNFASCSLFWSELRPCFIQPSSKLLHSYWPVVNQLCMVKMLEHLKGCHEEYIVCQWYSVQVCHWQPQIPNFYLSYHTITFQEHFRLAWHRFRSHLAFLWFRHTNSPYYMFTLWLNALCNVQHVCQYSESVNPVWAEDHTLPLCTCYGEVYVNIAREENGWVMT